jgi:microcystin-dependent protein
MAQPYVGEIRMFAGSFAPANWMLCNGASLSISENETLFQLIGTMYGGDGESNFNLPNMQSRIPIHMGNGPDGANYPISQMAGTESETLSTSQIAAHSHPLLASTGTATVSPQNNLLTVPTATQQGVQIYNNAGLTPNATLRPETVGPSGGSQPHENTQPFLCINFIICLYGLYPSPT